MATARRFKLLETPESRHSYEYNGLATKNLSYVDSFLFIKCHSVSPIFTNLLQNQSFPTAFSPHSALLKLLALLTLFLYFENPNRKYYAISYV